MESPDFELSDQRSRIIPNLIHLLDILDERKATATFFVLGWVARKFPEVLALIDTRGHEVASHGYSHGDITSMPREKLVDELRRSREIIEDIIKKPAYGYKAAGEYRVKLDPEILRLAAESGYRYFFGPSIRAKSIRPNEPTTAAIDGGKSIIIVPFSVIKKFGLSARFSEKSRVYPAWFIQRAIAGLNRRGQSAVINLKLWELDHNHRRPPGAAYTDFTSYGNLRLTEEKLKRLLDIFEFRSFYENLELTTGTKTDPFAETDKL